MESGPITSWEIDGERVAPKLLQMVTEAMKFLLLGRKAMTNLDSLLKSRDITLPTKVCVVKLWFFQWSCMDVRDGL